MSTERRALRKEAGDSNVITILVLAVVAVALCVIFKNAMSDIVKQTTKSVQNSIENILNSEGITGESAAVEPSS